ncbi:methyltransferase [Halalkalibacter hemicellulosilyticusJCM 9152]|uniref:Methyltransferase n=1 Tax=Halalkalibacter hemicellulosilyticusJCM 9152 TaxID=1236971 RepID=W4QF65_9BACI|nr:methyltransferase domain-containing protein [Halalkalibacter hemicellulosilyticus]GAE29959.1 methyltransferase [Halalkalibacter hemicellulosilyticusJCM 9152]
MEYYIAKLTIQDNDQLLDVDCNTGDTEKLIVDQYPKIHSIIGLDYEEQRINRAKQRWEQDEKKVAFVQGDAADLPFEDNRFDKVICAETLEWVKEPLRAIQEIRRVLKPNGIALIQHTGWDQTVYTTKRPPKNERGHSSICRCRY